MDKLREIEFTDAAEVESLDIGVIVQLASALEPIPLAIPPQVGHMYHGDLMGLLLALEVDVEMAQLIMYHNDYASSSSYTEEDSTIEVFNITEYKEELDNIL